LARKLQPSVNLEEIQRLQAETSEARLLITTTDATIGGAHDVRPSVVLAKRGGVIEPTDMLDIKSTLISARTLKKLFEKSSKGETEKSPSSPALLPKGEGSPLSNGRGLG
jgi:DNA mismatch repair protein MutS2